MAGSWSNTATNLIVLIEQITGYSGIFGYSPAPGAGNLVFSVAARAGVDPYNNSYPAGIGLEKGVGALSVYDSANHLRVLVDGGTGVKTLNSTGTLYTNLASGTITLANTSNYDLPAQLDVGGAGLEIISPSSSSAPHDGSTRIVLVPGNADDSLHASLTVGAINGITETDVTFRIGTFALTDPAGTSLLTVDNTGTLTFQGNLLRGSTDLGRGIQSKVEITANVTAITTEAVLMTIPSMTFVNGRAYRVHVWGLAQSTAASDWLQYRLRKGSATTAGTIYKDQMRVPTLSTANTNGAVNLTVDLVNTSGSDITTAVTLTASCNAGTGIFAASANNHATATIEDVGLASQWPGQPVT